MNYQPSLKRWKAPLVGVSIWLCLASSYVLAQGPAWWTTRGVLGEGSAQDYAPVNQGQLKWVATSAYDEMEACFGAGSNIAALIGSFSSSNNYLPVNNGQVKYVAQPFYDRLYEYNLTNTFPAGMPGYYPWGNAAETNDYAMANIGQVKYVFSFDSAVDTDGDGLSDWEEIGYGTDPYDPDSDDDGLSDGWEVEHGEDPLDPNYEELTNMRETARQQIIYHWKLYYGETLVFTNTPGSEADLIDMRDALNALSGKFYKAQ